MANKLDEIAEQVKSCQKCDLCQTRTNAVPGKGNPNAEIILVGEAPGTVSYTHLTLPTNREV